MPTETFTIASSIPTAVTKNGFSIKKICFLGGAEWQDKDPVYIQAYETARLLALNGYEIVNGGGPGVMRAATEGASASKGKTLVVTYHPNKIKRHYHGTDPNNKADEEIITLDYFDRTKVMLQNSDLHIVFNGSIGTLSELGMTWVSSWIHEPNHKPIIMFGAFWTEILDVMQKHMLINNDELAMLKVCVSPQEVLDYVTDINHT